MTKFPSSIFMLVTCIVTITKNERKSFLFFISLIHYPSSGL